MEKSQALALAFALSDYPDDLTYDEVLDLIADDEGEVVAWEPFEHMYADQLIQVIQDFQESMHRVYGE